MTGYKLVPVEPTPEMLAAGEYALEAGCYASGIYADMLAAAPAAQGEPVGWQFYQHGEWWNGDDRIKDHKKNTQEAGFRVRDVYTASQPAPDVSALVEALEYLMEKYPASRHLQDTCSAALAAMREPMIGRRDMDETTNKETT